VGIFQAGGQYSAILCGRLLWTASYFVVFTARNYLVIKAGTLKLCKIPKKVRLSNGVLGLERTLPSCMQRIMKPHGVSVQQSAMTLHA